MPEGDSVLQLSNRLQWMAGRTVRHTDIRVPRFATLNFDGEKVHRVWPYGKHLFMHIGQRVIHTHLKMEGVWAIHRAGQRWRRPGHTARIVLHFSPQHADGPEIEIVGHSLGFVRVFPFADYPQVVAHLGRTSWRRTGQLAAGTKLSRGLCSGRIGPSARHCWTRRTSLELATSIAPR